MGHFGLYFTCIFCVVDNLNIKIIGEGGLKLSSRYKNSTQCHFATNEINYQLKINPNVGLYEQNEVQIMC